MSKNSERNININGQVVIMTDVVSDPSRPRLTMASEAVSGTMDTTDRLTELQRKPVCLA
jgi:hypothetical protein